jgi:ribosome-binding protein aMBF1 (putative translation factor)
MKMAVTERVLVAMNIRDEAFSRDLGARIAQARKDRGLSQQQLADRLGVAQHSA